MPTTRDVVATAYKPTGEVWGGAPYEFTLTPGTYLADAGASQFPETTVLRHSLADGTVRVPLQLNSGVLGTQYYVQEPGGKNPYYITVPSGVGDLSLSEARSQYAGLSSPTYANLAAYVDARLAAIVFPWSNISSFVGSSLAQLATRSAGDLSSGNLAYARLPTGSDSWDTGPATTLTLVRSLTVSGTLTGTLTGNAATATLAAAATVLATARAINGVDFNGSAPITVPAAALTLTGTDLAATVVTSALTTIGTLIAGAVPAARVTTGTFGAGSYTFSRVAESANINVNIDADAGFFRTLAFRTGTSARWNVRADSTAEAGADAGSDFVVNARSDAGSDLGNPLTILRAAGGVATFARPTNIRYASGSASPVTVTLQIGSSTSAADWSTTIPFAALDFYSADATTLGAGVRGRIALVMAAANGGSSLMVFQTSPTTAGTMVTYLSVTGAGVASFAAAVSVATTLAMVSGQKFYPDGVTANGDTYLWESSANVLALVAGGVTCLSLASAGAAVTMPAGTTAMTPLKFASGPLLTTPVAGSFGFLTDDIFFTITTGTARKAFILDDGARLTSGRVAVATTNGRLIDGPTPTANRVLVADGVNVSFTTLPYGALPTGVPPGAWDIGVGNTLTFTRALAVSDTLAVGTAATVAGTLRVGAAAITAGAGIEYNLATGAGDSSSIYGNGPAVVRVVSTATSAGWGTSPWGMFDFRSADATGAGAVVRAAVGAYMSAADGGASGLKFYVAPTGGLILTLTLGSDLSVLAAGKVLTTGGLGVGNSAAATVGVGLLANKAEIFDAAGVSLGYVPIYATIT